MLLTIGVHIARGIANFVVGAGWTWPTPRRLFSSLHAVMGGDSGAGLPTLQQAGPLATSHAVHVWLVIVEVTALAGFAVALVWALRRWGPGRPRGMASTEEVERLLGRSRLRHDAPVIRPDQAGQRRSATGFSARLSTVPVTLSRRVATSGVTSDDAELPELLDRGILAGSESWSGPLRTPSPPLIPALPPAEAVNDRVPTGRARTVRTGRERARSSTRLRRARWSPEDIGWKLGSAQMPRGGDLWVPWDRTAGVIGPQGSGKTLDLLTPALLGAPGAALVTLTKVEDLLLSFPSRATGDRPCVVLDPFGLAAGLPELIWDPIAGCVDPMVAERRAKAFTQGTVTGAMNRGSGDEAAKFYAAEAAKVIQAYFHAAALTGRDLEEVLKWVANPAVAATPQEILRSHPHAEPMWHGLLQGALHGDDRTAGNTITTVQQALSLFMQTEIRRRCVPDPGRSATDLVEVIRRGGTIYLLGREDPYASASPLMTAVAEHVLDTALAAAKATPWGRLCPPLLACLDELPSTAPIPTLRTRMANERALGISFIYAAQTWRQLAALFGEHEARALFGLSNVLVMFGGSKDVAFNKEVSDLAGTVRIPRANYQTGGIGGHGGRSVHGEDVPVLRPEEIRQLPERRALVIAENGRPIIARLDRCIDGRSGRRLLEAQQRIRERLARTRPLQADPDALTARAVSAARARGLTAEEQS